MGRTVPTPSLCADRSLPDRSVSKSDVVSGWGLDTSEQMLMV
ncbi:hypothetical protein [uncultured Tateyamaria sp.]|nr:hypothetical protein [uncultured Tateyamaria sp.]